MKKIYKLLLITAALMCTLATTALASNYDSAAQELKNLGLFQGTSAGFDLDRAPNRAEAAVMLVRLLGAENQAKTDYAAGNLVNPFTDVPEWAAPHVTWLYKNKLATGVSSTVFGSSGQCTDKMFCTFVLRALGYKDSLGDFSFDEAAEYAQDVGIYNTEMTDGTFLRDHAVFLSYEALAAHLKNSGTTLLEKLVTDGAVSGDKAQALLAKVKAYDGYYSAISKWRSASAMDMSYTNNTTMETPATNSKAVVDIMYNSKVVYTDNYSLIESSTTVKNGENTSSATMWLKEGYLYTKSGSIKIKQSVSKTDISDLLDYEYYNTHPPVFWLSQASNVTSSSTGAGTLYTVTISDKNYNIYDILSALDTMDITNATANSCNIQVLVGSDGMISTIKQNLVCTVTAMIEESPVEMKCTVVLEGKVNATGSAVSIQFPDFSDYALR